MRTEFKNGLDAYRESDGWPSLAEEVAHFARVAAEDRPTPTGQLVFGIDECAKHPSIIEVAESFERDGLSKGTHPLWWQLREQEDGAPQFLVPATRRVSSSASMGKTVKGIS